MWWKREGCTRPLNGRVQSCIRGSPGRVREGHGKKKIYGDTGKEAMTAALGIFGSGHGRGAGFFDLEQV